MNASVLADGWGTFVSGRRATTTTFSAGTGPSINIKHGQNVTVDVSVAPQSGAGTPTGAVVFESSIGGLTEDVAALTNGTLNSFTHNLPGGTYNLFAVYSGDGTFASSVSNSIPATVSPENSTVTLGVEPVTQFPPPIFLASPFPTTATLPFGSAAVIDAQIGGTSGANAFPSGTVTISANGQPFSGALNLNSGGETELLWCFSLQTNCKGVGVYQFTAAYSGDKSYNSSSSTTPVTLTVTKATPTIEWRPSEIVFGTALGSGQLNAVATFMAGLPPSATSVAGTFTYTPPAGTVLPVGRHKLSVQFTPADTADFNTAFAQIGIEVRPRRRSSPGRR